MLFVFIKCEYVYKVNVYIIMYDVDLHVAYSIGRTQTFQIFEGHNYITVMTSEITTNDISETAYKDK